MIRTNRLASPARQATVQMLNKLFIQRDTLRDYAMDQGNSSTRGVRFRLQQPVGRTMRQTKTARDAPIAFFDEPFAGIIR